MSFLPVKPPAPIPPLHDGRQREIGHTIRQWLKDRLDNHANALRALTLGHTVSTPRYGASVALDLSQGGRQKVVATDGNAFTIQLPTKPTQLAGFWLIVQNSSGGALGAVTFAAGLTQSGFADPGNGKRTAAYFLLEGTSAYQQSAWGPAV